MVCLPVIKTTNVFSDHVVRCARAIAATRIRHRNTAPTSHLGLGRAIEQTARGTTRRLSF